MHLLDAVYNTTSSKKKKRKRESRQFQSFRTAEGKELKKSVLIGKTGLPDSIWIALLLLPFWRIGSSGHHHAAAYPSWRCQKVIIHQTTNNWEKKRYGQKHQRNMKMHHKITYISLPIFSKRIVLDILLLFFFWLFTGSSQWTYEVPTLFSPIFSSCLKSTFFFLMRGSVVNRIWSHVTSLKSTFIDDITSMWNSSWWCFSFLFGKSNGNLMIIIK